MFEAKLVKDQNRLIKYPGNKLNRNEVISTKADQWYREIQRKIGTQLRRYF